MLRSTSCKPKNQTPNLKLQHGAASSATFKKAQKKEAKGSSYGLFDRALRKPPYKIHEEQSVSSPPFVKGEWGLVEYRRDCKGDSNPENAVSSKKMYWLPYNKNLKEFSRKLRKNSTLGEILLWQQLRAGSIKKYTFNRQKPLDCYIVDFYCKPLKLVIEVDGSYHLEDEQKVKDDERQKLLEKMGLNFLRFSEQQVRKDMDMVLKEIKKYILRYEEGLN